MRSLILTLVFVGLAHAGIAHSELAHADFGSDVDSLVNASVQKDEFSGVIAVIEKGQTLYRHAFGLAHREVPVPMTEDNRFRQWISWP